MAHPQPKTSTTTVPGSSNQAFSLALSDINEGLYELQLALAGHDALATLLVYCTQRLDCNDTDIPVPPDQLASLLTAVNQRVRLQVEALKGMHHSAHTARVAALHCDNRAAAQAL